MLEFVEGPRLSTLIRRYGVILEQALPLALNLCSVLHYLAHERVVHLDVKPRNVIMAGSPRLIDLSVARSLGELGALRGHVGTDAYMAPEQWDAERWGEIGSPSDVWGLGVTVHEPLTGELPYPRPHAELAHPQLAHEPLVSDAVPPAVRPLVRSCLAPAGHDGTRDGDRTRGNDGTRGGANIGDADWTAGDDGTAGGDNSYVAPAPAPNYGGGSGWSDDGGGYGGGGGWSDDGGGSDG